MFQQLFSRWTWVNQFFLGFSSTCPKCRRSQAVCNQRSQSTGRICLIKMKCIKSWKQQQTAQCVAVTVSRQDFEITWNRCWARGTAAARWCRRRRLCDCLPLSVNAPARFSDVGTKHPLNYHSSIVYTVSQKWPPFYFLMNPVKN